MNNAFIFKNFKIYTWNSLQKYFTHAMFYKRFLQEFSFSTHIFGLSIHTKRKTFLFYNNISFQKVFLILIHLSIHSTFQWLTNVKKERAKKRKKRSEDSIKWFRINPWYSKNLFSIYNTYIIINVSLAVLTLIANVGNTILEETRLKLFSRIFIEI